MQNPTPEPSTQPAARDKIYYVRVGEHIKIGWTTNLYRRLRAYPPTAELLAWRYGTKADERALHQQFAAYLAGGREWFRDVPEIRAAAEAAKAEFGWQNCDPLEYGRNGGKAKPGPSMRPRSSPRGRGRIIR